MKKLALSTKKGKPKFQTDFVQTKHPILFCEICHMLLISLRTFQSFCTGHIWVPSIACHARIVMFQNLVSLWKNSRRLKNNVGKKLHCLPIEMFSCLIFATPCDWQELPQKAKRSKIMSVVLSRHSLPSSFSYYWFSPTPASPVNNFCFLLPLLLK